MTNLSAGAIDHPPEWQITNPTGRLINYGATAVLCAALFAPFGALPVFDGGYFDLVAPSILWLHVCAGVGATLLAVHFLAKPRAGRPRTATLLVCALTAFIALSAIPMAYADFPMLVFLGSPQSGKGVLWFIDIAVFVALAHVIRDDGRACAVVLCTAIVTTAVLASLLVYIRNGGTELLLRGGDSYAYQGLLLPFLTLLIGDDPRRRWFAVIAFTVAALCIAASSNKAAAIVAVVSFATFLTVRRMPKIVGVLSRLRFPTLFCIALAVAAALAYAVVAFGFRGTFDSIDSRILIAKIIVAALSESTVAEWLTGHGWGHTQAEFYRSLTESGASLLDNRWDFLWRDIFHSHNLVLELTYETGLLGLLAFAALLAALVACSDQMYRLAAATFALGYLLISSVWFEFAHSVPMLSLAVAALTVKGTVGAATKSAPVLRVAWPCSAALAALACFAASASLYTFDQGVKPYKVVKGRIDRADYPTASFPTDPRGNDYIRAAVYRTAVRAVRHAGQRNAVTPEAVITAILDDIEGRLAKTSSPELLLVGLAIFGDAHYQPPHAWIERIVKDRGPLWDKLAERHLRLAPKRTDVLVPYLSWQVTHNRMPHAAMLVTKIRRSDPGEPVALYFEGVIDTNNPTPETKRRGLLLIAEAVENGVERYLEVPAWLKKLAANTKAGRT